MSLLEKINEDLRAGMKARDEVRVSVLRMLKAAIRNREIEKGGALQDDGIVAVVSTMIKQRRDSVEQYTGAGRPDLAGKEEAEIGILQGYMPEQLSEEDVVGLIREAIAEVSASSPGDMGRVMKAVMPKVKGRADGRVVNQKVRELLGG